jgi:hypothetical protein
MTVKMQRGLLAILAGLGMIAGGAALTTWGVKQVKEELTTPAKGDVTITEKQGRKSSSLIEDLGRRLVLASSVLFQGPAEAFPVREIGLWEFTHRSASGNLLWHAIEHNALVDVGEQRLLEIYFRDATEPGANQYVSLSDASNPCSIAETDSLATANTGEPSTNGYARQTITRDTSGWPTSALDSGDWQITSTTETFTASGGSWGPVNCAVLQTSTDNTGDFLTFVALSQARTLASGETLDVSLKIKLQ